MKADRIFIRSLLIPVLLLVTACCSSKPGAKGTPCSPPASLKLGDVFFDYDQYALRPDAIRQLKINAKWMKSRPGRTVILQGHCDERGTREYNYSLGGRRADNVKNYLVRLGVDPDRMKTVSYGNTRPFVVGSSEQMRAKNRRVHFVAD
jgi:peptidoglycan-associated lipoprotein